MLYQNCDGCCLLPESLTCHCFLLSVVLGIFVYQMYLVLWLVPKHDTFV
jgi:hypothetical protein